MLWQEVYRLTPWRGFEREIDRLHKEVNRLFSDYPRPQRSQEYPRLNVWTSAEEAVVALELSGVDPKDLDISVVGNTLTLRGRRARPEIEEGETVHRQERRFGDFVRSIDMPFRMESDKVTAKYERGVLLVRVPRAEADKPRKILVEAGS